MNSILNTIGKTPLLNIEGVYVKLETTNPTGSIKDRMAWYIIQKAEERGELKKGDKILEATSGNTGISLAMISAIRGYRFTAIMPESMSIERRKMIKIFGGEIILTPAKEDVSGAIKKYKELIRNNHEFWLPKQFTNPDNISAHREGLGQEIIMQASKIDAFVAGVGTGGTLIGTAQALKKVNPNIQIVAVEPYESSVLSGKKPGLHKIQGIGEGFIPQIITKNQKLIDQIVSIKSEDAIKMSKKLAGTYGILVGTSSGANFLAAKILQKQYKKIVTVFPDRGERYLSTKKQYFKI
ncbi:MAG: cysteine synthase A [Patescibacteria group bacterium]